MKRVYDPPEPEDGYRVLVDRLWPRGLSKQRAALDRWDKDVAPSRALRTAFHHGGMTWTDFQRAYRAELAANAAAVTALRTVIAGRGTVTLLYASHDETHNHASLLREALET